MERRQIRQKWYSINFCPQPPHRHTIVSAKIGRKNPFFSNYHKNVVIRVFWHVEFISALKTQLILYGDVEKNGPKNKIKYLIIVIFYFWRSFHLKVTSMNCIKTLFLCNSARWNFQTPNSSEMVLINFRAHSDPHSPYYLRAKIGSIFLKNRRVELSFQCRNEFYMPKYPNNHIFMGFGEKRGFSTNFCPYYSMAMWRLWAQKLINTISSEFGVFPSKNCDSIVFMQFCQ